MVDVDRRPLSPALTPAHSAALRRLSARAATTTPSARTGLFTFSSLAHSVISRLRTTDSVSVEPGLTEPELARVESRFNFTFPPDLRAVLSLGLPSAPGFPDWRNSSSAPAIDLPIISVSLHLARNPAFWPRSSWGPRPSDPESALSAARSNLRRAPLLIPVSRHCYLPCRPCLAGNPVFFVDEAHVFVCSSDLLDFFARSFRGPGRPVQTAVRTIPRWVEFWTDAAAAAARAADRRRRSSSSSSGRCSSASCSSSSSAAAALSDPERYVEIRPARVPEWVGGYLDRIGSVLRSGGWGETEVSEMVHASASRSSDEEAVMDDRTVMDVLTVKADRCSNWLKRAGWSSEEVTGLGLGLGSGRIFREEDRKRLPVTFPPEVRIELVKLAQEICKC